LIDNNIIIIETTTIIEYQFFVHQCVDGNNKNKQ